MVATLEGHAEDNQWIDLGIAEAEMSANKGHKEDSSRMRIDVAKDERYVNIGHTVLDVGFLPEGRKPFLTGRQRTAGIGMGRLTIRRDQTMPGILDN
jgi:hypothetical protein